MDLSVISLIALMAVVMDRKRLFNQMLVWGLSMCVAGAVVYYGSSDCSDRGILSQGRSVSPEGMGAGCPRILLDIL